MGIMNVVPHSGTRRIYVYKAERFSGVSLGDFMSSEISEWEVAATMT